MEGKVELTKIFGVYAIECRVDSKVYVGSTTISFAVRWKQWRDNLKRQKANKHLQNAWNKFGEENFVFFVLEMVEDKSQVLEREQYWIDGLESYMPEKGYNFAKEAKASRTGKRSEQQSISQKGKVPWNKGKKGEYKLNLTPEQRAVRSSRFAGEKNHNYGRDFSNEHRKKIGVMGKKFSPETEQLIYQEYVEGLSTRALAAKYGTCTDVVVRIVLEALYTQTGVQYPSLRLAVKSGALPVRRMKFTDPEARLKKIRAAGRFDTKYSPEFSQQLFAQFLSGSSVRELASRYGGHPDTVRACIRRTLSDLGVKERKLRAARGQLTSI